jgi:hypothetical protein
MKAFSGKVPINRIVRTLLGLTLLTFILYVCPNNLYSKELGKNQSNIKQLLRNNEKIYLDKDAYKKADLKPFVDFVWDKYVKNILKDKEIQLFRISKEDISIALVDLNNDGKKDIIASIQNNEYFCGKFGEYCNIIIFVSSNLKNYKQIEVNMSQFPEAPIYIMKDKSNGLRNIILNEKFILKYDGKNYVFKK